MNSQSSSGYNEHDQMVEVIADVFLWQLALAMLIKALLAFGASQMGGEEAKEMMRDETRVFYRGIPPQETEGHTLSHKLISYLLL